MDESLAPRDGFRREARFQGDVARVPACDIRLLKPDTLWNNSGRAVRARAGFYRIPPRRSWSLKTSIDLPPGDVRLKFGGGLSGHNGLRDVAPALGTQDFWRVRLGIGHPRDMQIGDQEPVDYVLHAPRADERKAIDEAIGKALAVWPLIAAHDLQAGDAQAPYQNA